MTPLSEAIIDNIFQPVSTTLIFSFTVTYSESICFDDVGVAVFLQYEGAHLCFSYIKFESCAFYR